MAATVEITHQHDGKDGEDDAEDLLYGGCDLNTGDGSFFEALVSMVGRRKTSTRAGIHHPNSSFGVHFTKPVSLNP
jgi:hypothetical protein